jgi:amidophosphoribosyltransferase
LTALRDLGLVTQVFDEQKLHGLRGEVAIGHTRYSTTGSSQWSNAQPLVQHGSARTVALGHNGNLVNESALREQLHADGVTLRSTSDSEVIAALIANDSAPLDEAVANAMQRLEGAYSVVALSEGTLIALRDPLGFRPLVLGRIHDDWVVASETCALDLVGAEFVREVEPGEAVLIDETGCAACSGRARQRRRALHLRVLLPRPDTKPPGSRCTARVRMGSGSRSRRRQTSTRLPILDSGTPAAIVLARARVPFSEGLIRTPHRADVHQPDQELGRRAGSSSTTRRGRRQAPRRRRRLDRVATRPADRGDAVRRGRLRHAHRPL